MAPAERTPVPVSLFGIAVGSLALANAWRIAVPLWHLRAEIAELMTVAALAVWGLLLVLYAHKWLRQRAAARAELDHPVQSSFAALVPVSSLLASIALQPWSRPAATLVFLLAVVGGSALGLWLYGRLWQGGRAPEQVTPAIYLPAVAQNFVAGTAAAAFGWHAMGLWFFGAGLFSWFAIESLILGRAALQPPLPEALRPLLGIQLAPAVVGGVSWMAVNHGMPDLFAQVLLGYGLFQAALLLRLLPWIARQAFTPSFWAFSFGVAALPTLAMRLLGAGAGGPLAWLAPLSFAAANAIIGLLALKTLARLAQRRLLPAATPLR